MLILEEDKNRGKECTRIICSGFLNIPHLVSSVQALIHFLCLSDRGKFSIQKAGACGSLFADFDRVLTFQLKMFAASLT